MLRVSIFLTTVYVFFLCTSVNLGEITSPQMEHILIVDSLDTQSSKAVAKGLRKNLKQLPSVIKIYRLSGSSQLPKLSEYDKGTECNKRLYELVIYIGSNYTETIAQKCISYVKSGGRFWYIGDKSPFSGRCGKFSDIKRIKMQFYSRIFMRGAKDVWTEFPKSSFTRKPAPTQNGISVFGSVIKDYCNSCLSDNITVLQTRSGHLPWVRPSCKVVDYANGKYRRSNWCGRKGDTTKGIVLAMIEDKCIEYGGSKILFTSLNALYRLKRNENRFSAFINKAISLLIDFTGIAAIASDKAVKNMSEDVRVRMRICNYSLKRKKYSVSVIANFYNENTCRVKLVDFIQIVPPNSDIIISKVIEKGKLKPGLYKLSIKLITNDEQPIKNDNVICILNVANNLERKNFWNYPAIPRFLITFRDYGLFPDNGAKAIESGQDGIVLMIPWQANGKDIEHAVNWDALDKWVDNAKRSGLKIIFDAWDHRPYPEYFVHFSKQSGGTWHKYISVVVDENRTRWARLWTYVLRRYIGSNAIVGIFLTPAAISSFRIDYSLQSAKGFRKYLSEKYSLKELAERWKLKLAKYEDVQPPNISQPKGKIYQQIFDYHEYWLEKHRKFLQTSAKAIRKISKDIPLFLRGPYDAGPGFRDAAQLIPLYGKIAIHAENVETTTHTHIDMFGYHLRYKVPITAENGWPACRGEPLKCAFYKTLMGDYSAYLYSGGASFQLLPNENLIAKFAYLSNKVKSAVPITDSPVVGVLINETTQCVQRSGLKLDKKYEYPNIKMNLFRISYPMMAVSVDKPKLDGLRFLIDGGNNVVVKSESLNVIVQWIKNGGIFITFPKFALVTENGLQKSFVQKLLLGNNVKIGNLITFMEYENMTVSRIPLGRGSVLVINSVNEERAKLSGNIKNLLSEIPWKTEYNSGLFDVFLDKLFGKLEIYKPVKCIPYVPLSVKRIDSKKWYVIMYDVDPKITGGYFSYDDMTYDANPPFNKKKKVKLIFPWNIAHARDILTNKPIGIKGKTIKLCLPQASGKVLYIEGK